VIDASRGGLHLLFGHHKQWALLQKQRANPTLNDCSWSVLPYQFFEKCSRSKNCQFHLLQKLKRPAVLMKELAILWPDLSHFHIFDNCSYISTSNILRTGG
jgi:hypothetical protein